MTSIKAFIILCFFLITSAYGKIIYEDDKLFFRSKGKQSPIYMVNELIQKKSVKSVKLYGEGVAPIISFAKDKGKEKLYSVDENGYVYAIDPFSDYEVKKVYSDGRFQFAEAPDKKYKVNEKGFFIYDVK